MLVEVLMATYNGEKYIAEQINSILNQTYKNIKIIIRDDGSSDGTPEIIRDFASKYPYKISVIKDDVKCGSSASNFMELIKHASANYIMFSDQDDVWLPNKIEDTLAIMNDLEKQNGNEIPILVFANYTIVNENLEPMNQLKNKNQISKYNLELNRLIVQNYVTGCLMMANKRLCELAGDYDKRIMMHDWWLALIASSMGILYHFDSNVMLYRQHSNNVVGAVNIKSFKYRIKKFLDPNTKYSQEKYRDQILCFGERYGNILNNSSYNIVNDYINLFEKKNKLKRIAGLMKGKYYKSDLIRILGQFFYI